MASLLKFGVRGPFPLKNFPEGKVRVRVRNNAFPVAYVYQHGKSIRKFIIAEEDGYWIPFLEQQSNFKNCARAYDNDMPVIQIVRNVKNSAYGISGFSQFNEWAVSHDMTWARVCLQCINMQREDILTVLCVALLREKYGQLYTSQPGTKGGE